MAGYLKRLLYPNDKVLSRVIHLSGKVLTRVVCMSMVTNLQGCMHLNGKLLTRGSFRASHKIVRKSVFRHAQRRTPEPAEWKTV